MVKDNTLEVGQSRVGLMIDGLPETPRVSENPNEPLVGSKSRFRSWMD